MKNIEKRCGSVDEVVDLELNCKVCRTRLYAPVLEARQVVATVLSGGMAWLICPYGHVQYIRQKGKKTQD
jgi:hypothetical protein